MRSLLKALPLFLSVFFLSACYYSHPYPARETSDSAKVGIDSLAFYFTHHYWTGYNFEATDSIRLSTVMPRKAIADYEVLPIDTVVIPKGRRLVVARVTTAPPDSGETDSVWVKVACDKYIQGWTKETLLLDRVVPDDPISKFIHHFSDSRTAFFLTLLGTAILFWLIQNLRHKRFRMVHVRDIPSFYPTLLCLCVSGAATLYGSIQRFVPNTWVEFYFHPTLNPFNPEIPLILALFIASVWIILIVSVAVVDEMRRQNDIGDRLQYLASLAGFCMVLYLIFSLTTPYYIGYALLIAYWFFAVRRYLRHAPSHLLCGVCGHSIPQKGKCPHCGALNK